MLSRILKEQTQFSLISWQIHNSRKAFAFENHLAPSSVALSAEA